MWPLNDPAYTWITRYKANLWLFILSSYQLLVPNHMVYRDHEINRLLKEAAGLVECCTTPG